MLEEDRHFITFEERNLFSEIWVNAPHAMEVENVGTRNQNPSNDIAHVDVLELLRSDCEAKTAASHPGSYAC